MIPNLNTQVTIAMAERTLAHRRAQRNAPLIEAASTSPATQPVAYPPPTTRKTFLARVVYALRREFHQAHAELSRPADGLSVLNPNPVIAPFEPFPTPRRSPSRPARRINRTSKGR
jgi:hypothetical protein